MRKITLLLFCIITAHAFGQQFEIDTIQYNGHEESKYNITIVAEGYTESEMELFKKDAANVKDILFENNAYKANEESINIFSLQTISAESGVSKKVLDPSPTDPIKTADIKNTLFGIYFQNSFRAYYLDESATVKARRIAAEHIPYTDVVLILTNDADGYSGRASINGKVAVSTRWKGDTWGKYLINHELAHAMLGLDDAYATSKEEGFNKTVNNDPSSIRWKEFLSSPEVGIYEVQPNSGAYIPSRECMMIAVAPKYLCPVCSARADNHFSTSKHEKMLPPHTVNRLDQTDTSMKLGWDPIPGATHYEVILEVQDRNVVSKIVTTSEATLNGPISKQAYSHPVRIRAFNAKHSSSYVSYQVVDKNYSPEPFPVPTNIKVSDVDKKSFRLSWTKHQKAENTRIRLFNDRGDFAEIITDKNEFDFIRLAKGENYFFQLAAIDPNQDNGDADFFSNGSFSEKQEVQLIDKTADTEAPTAPQNLKASDITQNNFTLSWDAATDNVGVVSYDIHVFREAILDIKLETVTETEYKVTGLKSGTEYNYYVKAKDAAGNEVSSKKLTVTTLNEGNAVCLSKGGNAAEEFIEKVVLGSITNTSDSGNGYSDHTALSTNLTKGQSHTITITPKWPDVVYDEGYGVWIDYNQDGDFLDENEQVWTKAPSRETTVKGTFTIPSDVAEGTTKMRVILSYGEIPGSCGEYHYGETEDYTVHITKLRSLMASARPSVVHEKPTKDIVLHPNPAVNNVLYLELADANRLNFKISNVIGISVKQGEISSGNAIDLHGVLPGLYFISVNDGKHTYSKKFIKK